MCIVGLFWLHRDKIVRIKSRTNALQCVQNVQAQMYPVYIACTYTVITSRLLL